jgi:hypothetical protein
MRATDFKSQEARQELQRRTLNPIGGLRQHSIPIARNWHGDADIEYVIRIRHEMGNAHGAAADDACTDDSDHPSVHRRYTSLAVVVAPPRDALLDSRDAGEGQVSHFAALAAAVFQHPSPAHCSPAHFAVKLCPHQELRIDPPSYHPPRPQTAIGFYSAAGPLGIQAVDASAKEFQAASSATMATATNDGNGETREPLSDELLEKRAPSLHVNERRTGLAKATKDKNIWDEAAMLPGAVLDKMRVVSDSSSRSDDAGSAIRVFSRPSGTDLSNSSSLVPNTSGLPATKDSTDQSSTTSALSPGARGLTADGGSMAGALVNDTISFFLGELWFRRHQHLQERDADLSSDSLYATTTLYEPLPCCPLESTDCYVAVDLRDASVWIVYNA